MHVQETVTALEPAEVIRRAREFFQGASHNATFAEAVSETHVRFRSDVGTTVIAALRQEDGTTRVRGSAARQWALVGRFLTLLGEPGDARARTDRHGESRSHGARVLSPPAAPAGPGEIAA